MASRGKTRERGAAGHDGEKTMRWSYDQEQTIPHKIPVDERPTYIEMAEALPRPKAAARERSVISSRLTVFLAKKQADALDRLAREIRAGSGAFLNRGEIVRAVVSAVIDSKLDLSAVRNEAELKRLVLDKLS
ncbi:MAG: hypothetical protein JXR83_13640 [Deltaproteobacteria bacterium]|nr:hypothetical protein [Deltaproteobacteria bacterium]